MSPRRDDPVARDRAANAADRRGRDPYARKRREGDRAREREQRETHPDVVPDDAEDRWVVEDVDQEALSVVRGPQRVAGTLEELVRRAGWDERLAIVAVTRRWEEIAGPELARRSQPVRLRRRVLTLRVVDQTWATQLRYMLAHLTGRCAELLGDGVVERIEVTVGPLEEVGGA